MLQTNKLLYLTVVVTLVCITLIVFACTTTPTPPVQAESTVQSNIRLLEKQIPQYNADYPPNIYLYEVEEQKIVVIKYSDSVFALQLIKEK